MTAALPRRLARAISTTYPRQSGILAGRLRGRRINKAKAADAYEAAAWPRLFFI